MNMKKVPMLIGLAIAVVGIVFVLGMFGLISLALPSTTSVGTNTGQQLGIEITNSRINYPIAFSTVVPGKAYKWVSQIRNTGSVTWDTGWVNVRLGVNGATQMSVTCASNPGSCPGTTKAIGSFWVESCSAGTDVVACREDLPTWLFQWSADGSTWNTCTGGMYPGSAVMGGYLNKVCSLDLGNVTSGQTKTVYWRLTIPTNYPSSGSYPFIVQVMAWSGQTYAVAGAKDILSVGTIPPDYLQGIMALTSFAISGGSFYWALV